VTKKESSIIKLKWIVITAVISAVITTIINILIVHLVYNPFMNIGTKRHILNELQSGRDHLHLASASFELNHRRKTNIKFSYSSKVPDALNIKNGEKVIKMYQALDNGITEANRLDEELCKTKQDKVLIANLKSAIVRSIDSVDKLGSGVADYLGGKWRTPSKELSAQEVVTYYESVIITSSATTNYR
jgi:hypothetical protein